MDARAATDREAKPFWRRAAGALWALRSPTDAASSIVSGLVITAAAIPFAGWRTPTLWLAALSVLALGSAAYARDQTRRGRDPALELNPFEWLINAAYAAAAFFLTCFYGDAAQTLGVTLYGVVMFQILVRDYAAPRRLAVNLAAPVLSIVFIQAYAAFLLVRHGLPWRLITLLASPIIAFRVFRAVQTNLGSARRDAREAVARLSDSEMRYRLLAERSPDIIMRFDTAGVVEYVSPAASRYGYDPAALVGHNIAELIDPTEGARKDSFLAELAAGRPTLAATDSLWRGVTADGAIVAFESATSAITDESGRIIGAIASLHDVTARVALEDELRRRRAEAEAANEAKSQFLANMSHEVRTPLTGVVGFARLLQGMDDLPKAAHTHVSRIATSAEALLCVVNDVLDFSKLEARQVELDPHPFEPWTFFQETVDLVRVQAAAKGLTLTLDAPAGLPERVVADAARVRQVLLNLLTNAAKFTAEGRISVTAAHAEGQLRLEVADTGPGIAPEDAARLFQRFSQVDGSNARQHGGSGLGLAICKGLVEMMDGEIGLTSTLGRGSTFWFTIAAPESAGLTSVPGGQKDLSVPTGLDEGLRILVVDDVAMNRDLVAAILSPFDVRISTAASGAEAVKAACAQPFDLILMDLQMPGMDGMAATAAIRVNADLNRTTPILALSANVLPSHVAQCRAAGMDDHIGKPIDPADLLAKITQWTAPAEQSAVAAKSV